MSLSELQRMLARIATASTLREQFLDDPEGVAVSEGWDTHLACLLATVPRDRLRQYGESLVNKRCHEAARCLPLTFKALGALRFHTLFREYAGESTTRGPARHRDDAISFARVLRGERTYVKDDPAWLADLAAYEAASLRAADPRRRIVFLHLRRSPREISEAARSGDSTVVVQRRSSLIVWIRPTRGGPSRQCCLTISRF